MKITTENMHALRCAATLADVLPRVRIRIREGERTLVSVTPRPEQEEPGCGVALAPCRFRAAVASAHHRITCHGARFRFLDLIGESEPDIHIEVPAGDLVLPGHIFRVRTVGDDHLFLFLTDLDPAGCRAAIDHAFTHDGDTERATALRRIGFHHDELTKLTVVHTLAADRDRHAAGDLMTRLLEICVAAEAVAAMATLGG